MQNLYDGKGFKKFFLISGFNAKHDQTINQRKAHTTYIHGLERKSKTATIRQSHS